MVTLALFVLIQYRHVTGGQTNGRTRRSRKDRAMHSVSRVKMTKTFDCTSTRGPSVKSAYL